MEKEILKTYLLKLKKTNLTEEEQIDVALELDNNKQLRDIIDTDRAFGVDMVRYTYAIRAMKKAQGDVLKEKLCSVLRTIYLIEADMVFYRYGIEAMLKTDNIGAPVMAQTVTDIHLIMSGYENYKMKIDKLLNWSSKNMDKRVNLNTVSKDDLKEIRGSLISKKGRSLIYNGRSKH